MSRGRTGVEGALYKKPPQQKPAGVVRAATVRDRCWESHTTKYSPATAEKVGKRRPEGARKTPKVKKE